MWKGTFVGRVRATALSRVMERRVMGTAIMVLGPTVCRYSRKISSNFFSFCTWECWD